jgi:hypothetical protein
MPLTKNSTRVVAALGATSTETVPDSVAPAAGDAKPTVYGADSTSMAASRISPAWSDGTQVPGAASAWKRVTASGVSPPSRT